MTVKTLYEMEYTEFVGWMEYFDKRPIGWRDDLRAYYLLAAQGYKGKPHEVFPSLANVLGSNKPSKPTDTLKGSTLFKKMLGAKGGDKIAME